MDINGYAMYLQTHIKPWARFQSGNRVINCRCFYCPDSNNASHGHFYFGLGSKSENEPLWFTCQKCKSRGIVTTQKLMEWNIYDPEIAAFVNNYNREVFKRGVNPAYSTTSYYIQNDYCNLDDIAYMKLKYINDRLGTRLTPSMAIKYKIALNLKDILYRNRLEPTRDRRIVEDLDMYFVGFISNDNAYVSLRRVDSLVDKVLHPSIDKRYIIYNLFNKFDNTHRFYSIPTTVDTSKVIKIHIAEGVFDILSIAMNLRFQERQNVYAAVNGNAYIGVLKHFIMAIKSPNIEVHLYPDNDMDRYSVLSILDSIRELHYPMYIHRNIYPGEKDFGVPIDKINESIEKIGG